jgi:hypothetical protein
MSSAVIAATAPWSPACASSSALAIHFRASSILSCGFPCRRFPSPSENVAPNEQVPGDVGAIVVGDDLQFVARILGSDT